MQGIWNFSWELEMSWKAPIVVFTAATLVKILLIPAYRSTDFEVHRNWLAITHSLPLSQWYYEDTSEWTLDYPPFFAWFEWLLSQLAVMIDPLIVQVNSLDYSADSCVLFQRMSVICSDLVLLYAVYQYCCYLKTTSADRIVISKRSLVASLLLLVNYGLFIIDHIHFQYNGFLFGFLILSIVRLLQSRYLEGAFYFAVLLNFKHIFIYIALAYFVYLLRQYCFQPSSSDQSSTSASTVEHTQKQREKLWQFGLLWKDFSLTNFFTLGTIVGTVFLVSFGPFLYLGQLKQVLSRLFPFKRGLCHAYWAPNIWALYSLADKLLTVIGTKLGMMSSSSLLGSSMTSGLVGEMQFQALPAIPPWLTMVLSLLAMVPGLMKLWRRQPSCEPLDFVKSVVLCGYASFLFGWHVHEKAILMIILPMSLLVIEDARYTRTFLLLTTTGHISLFPLLFKPAETYIKLFLFVSCTLMTFIALQTILGATTSSIQEPLSPTMPAQTPSDFQPHDSTSPLLASLVPLYQLSWLETLYLSFLCIVQVYCLFVHSAFSFLSRFEFLPLLLTSVSCAVGIVWTWLQFSYQVLTE